MSIFALKELDVIKGKQKFFKLLKDGVCEFDEFEIEARINYYSQMTRIYALMNKVANLETLTMKQFKDITPKKEKVKEYEFKTKNLRVYVIHESDTGKIIICGGYKNSQNKDITHFREVKKQYLITGITK